MGYASREHDGGAQDAKRDLNATNNDIIYFSKPMVSRHGYLLNKPKTYHLYVGLSPRGHRGRDAR